MTTNMTTKLIRTVFALFFFGLPQAQAEICFTAYGVATLGSQEYEKNFSKNRFVILSRADYLPNVGLSLDFNGYHGGTSSFEGVIGARVLVNLQRINYTATFPEKLPNGKPNPNFDRVYAMLLRSLDNGEIKVCLNTERVWEDGNFTLTSIGAAPKSYYSHQYTIIRDQQSGHCLKVNEKGCIVSSSEKETLPEVPDEKNK